MIRLVKPGFEDDLKLVILECPYDTWNDPLTQDLFNKTVKLKLTGYTAEYPYGVLPIDTTDFIGTHILVCKQKGVELHPILGYKSVSLERCRIHNLSFPALSMLQTAKASDHCTVVSEMLNRCESKRLRLRYDSAYTIHPEIRKDRELVGRLKAIMTGVHVLYHQTYQTQESLLCGVTRFKTEKYFNSWGYAPLDLNGRILPPFQQVSLYGEDVMMLSLKHFSEEALLHAREFQSLWEKRISIRASENRESGIKKAA